MRQTLIAALFSVLAAVGMVAPTAPATAAPSAIAPTATGAYYFHSPSGRYSCAIFPSTDSTSRYFEAGCQGETNVTTATEQACVNRWGPAGTAMALEPTGSSQSVVGHFVCLSQGVFVGGTTADGSGTGRITQPVLPYGQSLTAEDITCTMRVTGITCRNARTGHGFFISLHSHRGF